MNLVSSVTSQPGSSITPVATMYTTEGISVTNPTSTPTVGTGGNTMNGDIIVTLSAVFGGIIILVVLVTLITMCCWCRCHRFCRRKGKLQLNIPTHLDVHTHTCTCKPVCILNPNKPSMSYSSVLTCTKSDMQVKPPKYTSTLYLNRISGFSGQYIVLMPCILPYLQGKKAHLCMVLSNEVINVCLISLGLLKSIWYIYSLVSDCILQLFHQQFYTLGVEIKLHF